MSEETVPKLDLAPKLKRPLSLLNPLDYLRLLYWVFFFPQAVRWYVETFGKPEFQNITGSITLWKILRNDPVQRRLGLQSIVTLLATAAGVTLAISALGVPINWIGVAVGVALTLGFGPYLLSIFKEVEFLILCYIQGGILLSILYGVMFGVESSMAFLIKIFMSYIVTVPMIILTIIVGGFGLDGPWIDIEFGISFGISVGLIVGVVFTVVGGIGYGIVVFVVVFLTFSRLLDYLLLALPAALFCSRERKENLQVASRVVFLPLPKVQKRLEKWLEMDWDSGLFNVNQMLSYTMQRIPVVKAINTVLACTSADILLHRVVVLACHTLKWDLVRFVSVSFYNHRVRSIKMIINRYFILPGGSRRKWQVRFPEEPRLDTPARAACAGFWFWHQKESDKAVEAFNVVRDLRNGTELYGIAQGVVKGKEAADLQAIADWEQETEWLKALPHPELRPGTLAALRTLRAAAGEARVAHISKAPLNRSTAIGRANAALTRLIESGDSTCPQPEWPLIEEIAQQWRDIFIEVGGTIGEEVLRQPILNPYEGYSGLPVTGTTFVGRADIMKQIETRWATKGRLAPLILYGHRRMGKTSVLRNLELSAGSDILLVYLDMQDVGWVDHTGQLLLGFAEAVHTVAAGAGLRVGTAPKEADYTGLGLGRRALNTLLNRLDTELSGEKRLILAIDEFEIIEQGIEEKRIAPGLLSYLRSVNQKYNWLGLIFAGLHTLDEMGRDYRSAFYGQAEYIRLGYLPYEDAIKLITQPHPDFALEYEPDLFEEIYRLTYGQPYLLQRLCWELVTRWNERFIKKGKATPRTLTLDDLVPVLTPDFYQSAGYYFDGVWSNVTENEQILMRILAGREKEPWLTVELAAAAETQSPTKKIDIDETLDLLCRHDVIVKKDEEVRFASELMRRWMAWKDVNSQK